MRATAQVLAMAVCFSVVIGCRRSESAALPYQLVADGKPAITVQLESTYIYVTSRNTGAKIIPGIEIFAGGGCIIRDFEGTELERRISQQQLADLLRFFEAERIFGLSDRAVDEAAARNAKGSGTFRTHQINTRLIIRQPNILTYLSRYDLTNEIKSHPNCRELQAIQRCVDKVYEIVGAKREPDV
jgi:hypothetical protein